MSQDQRPDYFSQYYRPPALDGTSVGHFVPPAMKRYSIECRGCMDEIWRFYADQNMVDDARQGFRIKMDWWLENGADPNALSYAAGYIGIPALFAAKQPGCIRRLLMWGADPTMVWHDKSCILHHLRQGHTAAVGVIAEYLPAHVLTELRPRAAAIIKGLIDRKACNSASMGRRIFGIGLGE